MKKHLPSILAVCLTIFGLLTVFMGGSVIFNLLGIREIEENYVLFVVWGNWVCGFLYLFAAYGFVKRKEWTTKLLWVAVILLIITFIGFAIHINAGGIYEAKTVLAMTFRTSLTLAMAIASHFMFSKKDGLKQNIKPLIKFFKYY